MDRRLLVSGLAVLALLTGVAGLTTATGVTPDRTAVSAVQSSNNTTESAAQEWKQKAQNRQDKIDELKNKNSELNTKVVSLNGKIEKLQFRLNQSEKSTGVSSSMAQRMKEMGAWDPQDKEPALIIVRDEGFGPVVYQYVGPGSKKADTGFNGQNAWTEVAQPESSVREQGQFNFSIIYGLPGMKTEYGAGSMGEYRRITRNLEEKLNSQSGFAAWSRWNNQQRNKAETYRTSSLALFVVFASLFGLGLMWAESKTKVLTKKRRQWDKRDDAAEIDGLDKSYIDKLREVIGR